MKLKDKVCVGCGKIFIKPNLIQKYCCLKCRNQSKLFKETISNATKGKCGGYRNGSGIGKSGWYKGIWCDSSYELAWVIYNIEHNLDFKRNTIGYKYVYNNEEHTYYPDFIIKNTLIEIKGFLRDNDYFKFKSVNDMELIVLFKKDLKKELDYVINKYGKNYISLYEKI